MDRQELLRASVLCARSLRANIKSVDGTDGRPRSLLVAGSNRLHSLRTPDFCFAALGLLRIGEFQAVRDSLETLFSHQREDGLFPILLDTKSLFARIGRHFFGSRIPFKAPLHPVFVPSVETNALVVTTACRYALEGDRPAWAGLNLAKMELALSIKPAADSPFMTHLQYWKSLASFAALLGFLGRTRDCEKRRSEASMVKRKLEERYWDETRGLYGDSTAANLAAIAWGFASEEQASRIVRGIDRSGNWTPWGPSENGSLQLWISALGLQALRRTNREVLLKRNFSKILSMLEENDGIFEAYDLKTGKALPKSEKPFSWSAGMLVEAFHELLKSDEVSCDSHS